MKRKDDLGKLIVVVILLWVAADLLSQAVSRYWQPDLVGAVLIFVAAIFFSLAILGDRITDAL